MKAKQIKRVFIWTQKPKELAQWYVDALGLKVDFELNLPDDTGVSLSANEGGLLWIGYHDKVDGKNKDPYRFMVGFIVDSVEEMTTQLKDKGATILVKPFLIPTKDKYCMTFADPEGNIMQIFSLKP